MLKRNIAAPHSGSRLGKATVVLWFLVSFAIVMVVGDFGTALMGAADDTIADRELGQIDFMHNGGNLVDGIGLGGGGGPALDTSVTPNRLYVADPYNFRILGWNDAAGFSASAPADLVIGQPDVFATRQVGLCNPTASNLCVPVAVAVDHKGNLYVADSDNNRVLEYLSPVKNHATANVVFGQLGSFTSKDINKGGVSADSLNYPYGLAIDSNNNLYVADTDNSRVLYFDRTITRFTSASLVFGQRKFSSNTCDEFGVRADSLCAPVAVGVDAADNLYVADATDNRVLEYDLPPVGGTTARLVFGQPDMNSSKCNSAGTGANSLCTPQGVTSDKLNRLYISDTENHRILGYETPLSGDTTAKLVLGQGGSFDSAACNKGGVSAESLCHPGNLTADDGGNLYVSDGNSRVLFYSDPFRNGSAASRVLGQAEFNQSAPNFTDARGMGLPSGVAIDASVIPNRLYVMDTLNNRVLGWKNAAGFLNGQSADLVVGQPDFLSSSCNNGSVSAASLCAYMGSGIAVDATGNLYVADTSNNRVLEYNTPFSKDAIADAVFGQEGSFISGDCNHGGLSADSLCFLSSSASIRLPPMGVALDETGNLYIADTANNRVLEYDTPLIKGTTATRVFGPSDFVSRPACPAPGFVSDLLCYPAGAAVDSFGHLYISDTLRHRILEYDSPLTISAADRVYGQGAFLAPNQRISFPEGLALDMAGNLYVAESGRAVIEITDPLDFNAAASNLRSPYFGIQPLGVAVDPTGNVYVGDRGNHRVLEYDTPPTPRLPDATASPAALTFGAQVIGTSSTSETATLINNRFRNLSISKVDVSGDFVQSGGTCGSTLGPAACTISVGFQPTATGTRSGSLVITDDANNSPQLVALKGTGIAQATLSPSAVSFGIQTVGTSSTVKIMTLTNNLSPNVLRITSIGFTGADSDDFSQTNTCGIGIAGKSSCAIAVIFSPKSTGSRKANLSVFDNAVGSPQVSEVNGTGIAPTPTATPRPTPTRSPIRTPTSSPTPTPKPGTPVILSIPGTVLVGGSFKINGSGFTPGSVVNFFVATVDRARQRGPADAQCARPPPN